MWIANADRCRDIDQRASEEFGIPAKVLMERAGLAVFEVVKDMAPEKGHLCVFCGKGNNGGDGFVVARLAQAHGYGVDCLVACEESELSTQACEQMLSARAGGVDPIYYSDPRWKARAECVGCRDLIVDALLGTGAHGETQGPVLEAIEDINRSGVPVISVDVPSGIRCDTGEELGESVWACRTVTFGFPKPFLFQGIGLEHSGYWQVAEIGYPNALLQEATDAQLIEAEWVASLLPERLRSSHKGDNGSVLIVAGSASMPGAATLAALAALRAGAGLVTVASIDRVCAAVATNVPEALVLPLPEIHGVISADAVHVLLEAAHRFDSAVFGPGLTHQQPIKDLLDRLWQSWTKPCVVDADALNSVSEGVKLPKGECVLTPHPGEMSRLLHSSTAEIQADRFRTVQHAVESYGKCVLLKGPYSIIGEPAQSMMVNSTGNSGLASGGMGDVLSGITATLLAQELPPYYAISCAAYWHGVAADLCADEIGTAGYLATDVANFLPRARAKIFLECDSKPSLCS